MDEITNSYKGQNPVSPLNPKSSDVISDVSIEKISQKTISKLPNEDKPIGNVTVLVGTSSVGKSSIIAELKKLQPKLEESGPDLAGFQKILDFLENQKIVASDDYQFLKSVLIPKNNDIHILDAISGNVFNFKTSTREEEKNRAYTIAEKLRDPTNQFAKEVGKNIERIMLDKVFSYSKEGKVSIFDTLFVDNIFKHQVSKAPIKTVLIYCPFHELTNRLEKRNREALEKGELSETRAGPEPLFQFAKLFGPKQEQSDVVVETISRDTVEKDFDTNFDAWLKIVEYPKWENLNEEEKKNKMESLEQTRKDEKNRLLQELGFTGPSIEKVDLTPRSKRYDQLIDTSLVKPAESAQILDRLHK